MSLSHALSQHSGTRTNNFLSRAGPLALLCGYPKPEQDSNPHPIPVITQKNYFESRILHIVLTSENQNADVSLI